MRESQKDYTIEQYDTYIHQKYDIASLHIALRKWQEATEQNIFTNIIDSQEDLSNIESNYLALGGNFFLAIDMATQEVVGFVGIKRDGYTGIVKRLAVLPQHHRKGIARGLMTALIAWAKATGLKDLLLTTCINENAEPLYTDLGFETIDLVPIKQGDPRFQDKVMKLVF